MAKSYGKAFEQKFKIDWQTYIKDSFAYRLHDQLSGYKIISRNPCDFICYKYPSLYLLDCKSLEGTTFNFSKLTQWEYLASYKDITGVNAGTIIWFISSEVVCYVPIEEYIRLKELGYKSINVKMIDDENFNVYKIPGQPKRLFLDNDYSVMLDIAKNKLSSQTV